MDPFPVWSGYGPAPSDCRRYLRASPGAFPSGIQEIGFDRANDEIGRLPEELLSAVLAKTTARDASRAAAVSQPFRAAADSDAVWTCFVPALTDEELEAPAPRSKKELFFLLLERPVLLQDGLMAMWLDRETLAKCYMLSARKLFIASGDMPQHWSWIPLSDSRFSQGAQLIRVTWFEIQGQIHRTMLSPNSTYVAYLVFKPVGDYPLSTMFGILRASVRTEEANLFRDVLLDEHWPPRRWRGCDVAERPRLRADGWKEVELGQFYNAGGEDGEVSFGLMETNQRGVKARLILHGIEIRCLKSG
ncbi:putative F-box protein PP2-B12 [Hordeum vulgare]|uniref:Uncharacterized protein n=1 Tax=Hordeum vulgare subsp. vulgare TaxID=112509 RepID=A0A287T189_HORVV|nr:putative F-box protein PP2-B12 [Hordeum vulgare subsp. vulgare]XP_044946093.1 putative F-box protein PP2-B12 [Hordeum vulgare subsp. vulgare]XP_044946094.1 putative F-box protein PP2-B12 [Hordeum vulgare subsp. vulgare]XP_044946095.1 putative F-box protein PP2-B12 [Hordeum vulgare subsp. vulgare]XP_044946096.1 putative F-box protein PP2-B12 [Hordeum vulgare subsp. vulgare]XP_044946097.1 putative F-box protein PP2-B12 [Hordeum vulgare subsp. vulgare]XP_044946098.1 putative F-box protein PP2